jgi:hypothetical protein
MSDRVLRVIYFEDEDDQFEIGESDLPAILAAKSGAVFERATTIQQLEQQLKSRPHVVFCDNDHGEGKRQLGVYAISKFKVDHPDTLFCLITRQLFEVGSLGSYTPNPDIIISKEHLSSDEYQDYLRKEFKRLVRRSPIDRVDASFDLKREGPKHSDGHVLSHAELHSLIEQVVDAPGVAATTAELVSAELEVLKGGFSGSGVYNLKLRRADGKSNVPAVLKVSEAKKAAIEFENFLRFVKWRLPYLWRVDVLGTGSTNRFGAICYSLAMAGGAEPISANERLRAGDFRAIQTVLAGILHSNNQTWYGETVDSKRAVREYFAGEPFFKKNRRRDVLEKGFLSYITNTFKDAALQTGDAISLFGTAYPKPDKLIFSNKWGSVPLCVCHGDLNGNNILSTEGGDSVVLIDFQDTGMWHVFRDFVSLEISARLEWPEDRQTGEDDSAVMKRYLLWESTLRTGAATGVKGYLDGIRSIRDAAKEKFSEAPFTVYLAANIVHAMWLFEKGARWAPHKRMRLAASILESSLALSDMRA